MSSGRPLYVLFLWHQHQPYYKDPVSNRYELPWVRLHATKDYYDMVAVLDEFPKIKANFNLVPSMLAQLDEYAEGKANDPFIENTLKNAKDLQAADKLFLLQNFFMANWDRMIDPHPRYRELLDKRGRRSSDEDLKRLQQYFKEQDWRDLQTWFNLVWIDPLWREKDPFIHGLWEKGRGFTEEDKHQLIEKMREICGLVVQKHRDAADRGQIEITATPFYHPILPLLCDTDEAKMAMPKMVSPKNRFMQPGDARLQIERALADHERRFGKRPRGMWPSEGSVSTAVAGHFADLGVRWIATDEAILAQSMGDGFHRDDLFRPYRLPLGDKSISFFFRDHGLSDAIGFVYASWKPEDAAADFVERLVNMREHLEKRDGGTLQPHVVPVILDGENCWEYYDQDGLPFLRALYRRLSEEPRLQTVTGSEYLDWFGETAGQLPRLFSGSWINGNFGIWIGHREDNLAWDHLARTRQFLTNYLQQHPDRAESKEAKAAWESIYIAEGSDWCWWYGDDHSSANDETFDYLFRKHLMNVYTLVGEHPPEELHVPIKVRQAPEAAIQPPIDFISPKIDGRATSYYEWHAAGFYKTQGGGTGTMHRVEHLLKSHHFGFDLHHLHFRFDFGKPFEALAGVQLRILFLQPSQTELDIPLLAEEGYSVTLKTGPEGPQTPIGHAAFKKILEVSIPLKSLPHPGSTNTFRYMISIHANGQETERWPAEQPVSIPYPAPDTFAANWSL